MAARCAVSPALFVALVACGGAGPTGDGDSSGPLRPDPGTGRIALEVQVASARAVDRVTVEVKPAGASATLTWDPATQGYVQTLAVPAVTQTVTVTAYAGKTKVAGAGVGVPVMRDAVARAFLQILDTKGGWPLPTRRPAVTALVLSPTEILLAGSVGVAASAADPSGAPAAFRWTSSCAGSFASPTSASTRWSPSASGRCDLTVHVTTTSGNDARSGAVIVTTDTGAVPITGEFVPWPIVRRLVLDAAEGACDVPRSASNASCAVVVRPGERASLRAFLETAPDATFGWTDDCGGEFAPLDLSGLPAEALHAWTAPRSAYPVVCTMTATLSLFGMVDSFAIATLVSDGTVLAATP